MFNKTIIKDSEPKMYKIDEKKTSRLRPIFTEIVTDEEISVYRYFIETRGEIGFGAGGFGGVSFMNTNSFVYAMNRSTAEIMELRKQGGIMFSMRKDDKRSNLYKFMESEPGLVKRLEQEEKLNYDIFLNYIMEYNPLIKTNNTR